ncbi:hypothetical protein RBB79_10840 [Tunturiibacter empetritectus]|uniref:Uncharacterized protein n=1 Tax=Tunturiibacter lichenicola TaxID=2051959 RepID=A0A852VKU2_9BACT|nr:hypothetical protein [Edaphobacter lichenicola]NYF90062.1 hypothetical protein [Edaphobacter lichenicola]
MSFPSGRFVKHIQIFLALPIIIAVLSVPSAGQADETATPQLPLAGTARPANVPAGFVITPFGYFHSSCVEVLKPGERLLPDHRMQHADGSIQASAASCAYPHFTATGNPMNSGAPQTSQTSKTRTGQSPEVNGWVENSNVTTGSPSSSYGALIARWTVPPHPLAEDGQVLFFFPGLEDINDQQTSILQPVLGLYGGQWTIASWNCCLSGIVVASPAVNVQTGDRIYGSMTNTCGTGTLSCATWNVLSVDLSTGQSTTLADTPSDRQVFNWAFGGVLEAYYVVRCDDYPPDRTFTFEDVTLFDQKLRRVHDPVWSSGAGSGISPRCGYGVSAESRRVTLHF